MSVIPVIVRLELQQKVQYAPTKYARKYSKMCDYGMVTRNAQKQAAMLFVDLKDQTINFM